MNVSSVSGSAATYLSPAPAKQERLDAAVGSPLHPELSKAPSRLVLPSDHDTFRHLFSKRVGPREEAGSSVYGEVHLHGRVIATLYNNGQGSAANGIPIGAVPGEGQPTSGPELAAWRAAEIARAAGGTVVRATTAMEQRTWEALAPSRWVTDTAALDAYIAEFRNQTQDAVGRNASPAQAAARGYARAEGVDNIEPSRKPLGVVT